MFILKKLAMFDFTNSGHVLQEFPVLKEHLNIKTTLSSVAGKPFVFHNDIS